ncbi:semaphorin-4B-like, partial [Seriola lalandi dorsalis]
NSETLTMSMKPDEGRGRCPYDPYQRNTAIIVDGELYTGTVADYRGNRPVISRHLSEGRRVDLKLDDTLGWLEGECDMDVTENNNKRRRWVTSCNSVGSWELLCSALLL